jgi:hypothetical protein
MKGSLIVPDEIVQQDAVGVLYVFVSGDLQTDVSFNGTNYPYAIKKNGKITLYGTVLLGAPIYNATVDILALPAGFRPATNQGSTHLNHSYLTHVSDSVVRAELSLTHIKQGPTLVVGVLPPIVFSISGISYDAES